MFNSRKRKKKNTGRTIDSVFFDHSRKVLALKKKTIVLEVERSLLRLLYLFLLGVTILVSAGFFIFGSAHRTRAETALLYPQTCLGGWNNSTKAAGTPELDGKDPTAYSSDNSASVAGALAQIFCGDFKGEIPEKTAPTEIRVRLSYALQGAPIRIETITGDNFASSTETILNAPVESSSTLLIPISTPVDSSASTTPAPDATVPATSPDSSAPPPPDESAPLPATDVPASVPDTTPTPPVDAPADTPAAIVSWLFGARTAYADELATTTASSTDSVSPDALLEVLYTLDGTTWTSIGTVTAGSLRTDSFTIPIDSIKDWSDLSKLQVSLRTSSGLDSLTTVYLDGMTLSVGYVDTSDPLLSKPFTRANPSFETANPVAMNISFDPAPCTGKYWGFYWFGEGGVPYAFADLPLGDIGKEVSHDFLPTSPFVELAGVIVSDKPFPAAMLELDSSNPLGVAWPAGAQICTPAGSPLESSALNPDERFHIAPDSALSSATSTPQ